MMSEKPPVFGSYGMRTSFPHCKEQGDAQTLQATPRKSVFGKRVAVPTPGVSDESASPRPVFGKRATVPTPGLADTSLAHARLAYLLAELTIVFDDKAQPDAAQLFILDASSAEPRLLIRNSAVVSVDTETGHLVFREEVDGIIVSTTSEERLLDHVVCHLAAGGGAEQPHTADRAAQILVGQTLAEVERRLILQTLRHCRGNRTRTAGMLGISLRTVRNKLRSYWHVFETAEPSGKRV